MRSCLLGSALSQKKNSEHRHLQAPLTFRTVASVVGAAYDGIDFCQRQVEIELNAHQQNPMSLEMEEDQMISSGHFDMQGVLCFFFFFFLGLRLIHEFVFSFSPLLSLLF
jgi:histidine ammonia-lyase